MVTVHSGIIALLVIGAMLAGMMLLAFWPLGLTWTIIVVWFTIHVMLSGD